MNCGDARADLTAYLDGELDAERGRGVRGHLRSCEPCRIAARDDGVLRDGLRALPTLDPPAQLWVGIRRQLAEAEVVDSRRPRWQRVMAAWARPARGLGLAIASGAIGVAIWHADQRRDDGPPVALVSSVPAADGVPCASTAPRDVALDLAAEITCVTEAYAAAAAELMRTALDQRARWDDDRKHLFDEELDQLRHHVEFAAEGRARQRAYRAVIRFLQRATTRDHMLAEARGAL